MLRELASYLINCRSYRIPGRAGIMHHRDPGLATKLQLDVLTLAGECGFA